LPAAEAWDLQWSALVAARAGLRGARPLCAFLGNSLCAHYGPHAFLPRSGQTGCDGRLIVSVLQICIRARFSLRLHKPI
jgi:hypothetical protein